MSTRETLILECDRCKTTGDSVETHPLGIDGTAVETEACARCWTKVEQALRPFMENGRRQRGRRRRVA